MINSISSTHEPGLMTAMMKDANAKQNLEVALVKKGQDIEKAQGEAMLKLIENSTSAKTGGIDTYA